MKISPKDSNILLKYIVSKDGPLKNLSVKKLVFIYYLCNDPDFHPCQTTIANETKFKRSEVNEMFALYVKLGLLKPKGLIKVNSGSPIKKYVVTESYSLQREKILILRSRMVFCQNHCF